MVDYERHFNGAIKSEYAIWGIPPEGDTDTLLQCLDGNGKPITDEKLARKMVLTLERHYGCKNVTIQKITY